MTSRLTALVLVVATLAASHPALAAAPALLEGSVSGDAALTSARVELADRAGSIVASAPVAGNGAFRMEAVPAGTYRVAVTTPAGAYVVGSTVALAPGSRQNVQIAVKQQGQGGGAGSPSFWDTKWGKVSGVGLLVGGILVVAALVDNSGDSGSTPVASESQPTGK
jgi:hypothetical protein